MNASRCVFLASLRLSLLLIAVVIAGGLSAAEPPAVTSVSQPVPLNAEKTVLFDKINGKLILKANVCLRDGLLEMLMCSKQTKEHESILTIDAKSHVIHAGLLALGAKPGQPARFNTKFTPPTGQKLEISFVWTDKEGRSQRARVQEWIRHSVHRYFETPLSELPAGVTFPKKEGQLIYDASKHQLLFFGPMSEDQQTAFLNLSSDPAFQKAVRSLYQQGRSRELEADFVFAGSVFSKRPDGTEVYQADGGSLICVANFSDAMIDINMESTSSNDAGLLFEPWTERVPEVGTEVIVEIRPVPEKTGISSEKK